MQQNIDINKVVLHRTKNQIEAIEGSNSLTSEVNLGASF